MSFLRDERGAVTIEWVVLTAGVIALGITAYVAFKICLLYTSPSPRDLSTSRMPSSA